MQLIIKLVFCVYLFLGYALIKVKAQTDTTKKVSISLLPVLVADPYIGFGYGALTNINFLLGPKETTRYSNARAYVIKTTNNQFAVQLNHQVFLKHEKWIVQGKIQYLDWPEFTYALGANTSKDGLFKDTVKYKAIDLEERVLYQLKKYHFLGLQYKLFSSWDIDAGKDSGRFFENYAIGTQKFVASGIGIHYVYDSRDNVQNAYKGSFLELAINPYFKITGSTQQWINLRLDLCKYHQFNTFKSLVWANRLLIEQVFGETPYLIMPQTGRFFSTRGYAQGRYRGDFFGSFESEIRANVWKFIGVVAFGGLHTLSEPGKQIKYLNPSYGAGLRFCINKAQRTNIRVDYAQGINNNSGFYFQVCEVF